MDMAKLRNNLESLAIIGTATVEYFEDSQDEMYTINNANILFAGGYVMMRTPASGGKWFSITKPTYDLLMQIAKIDGVAV